MKWYILFIFVVAFTVSAADQVTFIGNVLDEEGKLVPHAEINLFYPDGKSQDFSDEHGAFKIIVDADNPKTAKKDGLKVKDNVYFDYEDIEVKAYSVKRIGVNNVNLTIPVVIDPDMAAEPVPGPKEDIQPIANDNPSVNDIVTEEDENAKEMPIEGDNISELDGQDVEGTEGMGLRMLIAVILAVGFVVAIYYFMNKNVD